MDISGLAPAPWKASGCHIESAPIHADGGRMVIYDEGGHNDVDAAFIALARNAFDVMMRRRWEAHWSAEGWWVDGEDKGYGGYDANDWHPGMFQKWLDEYLWSDPYTALVEADKWYVANVENK